MDFKANYFPIGYICAETGVNPVTLRAWERRYGLIHPKRTMKGHRLYSHDDIMLIKQILFLMGKGHSVSKIKPLLYEGGGKIWHAIPVDGIQSGFQGIVHALEDLDQKTLSNAFNTLYSVYSAEQFADLVYPQLIEYLENEVWLGRACVSAQRTLLLDSLETKLWQNLYQSKKKAGKKPYLVVGFLPTTGQQKIASIHGLMIANILKDYDHNVEFLSSVDTVAELFNLSKQFSSKTLVIFTTAEPFTVKNILYEIKLRNISNMAVSLVFPNNALLESLEVWSLLPSRFTEIYGALNRLGSWWPQREAHQPITPPNQD
ncbi:MerR family transcriptional regulator [Legionella clemsonensis]|uniref:HTH-type transcriptional repressor YcgE n=1 Tax=Legionella clemsonensis TaxID=1867846 RepID=A0A222P1F0_9GAMM|nr:MerR family transcriptional regulator [Legionella clemsonensis]ASQ45688.1 HTH-type transcriptional repressor YcgE [Legionella clemsonensis]